MKKFYLNIFFLILIGINFNLISQSKIDFGNQYMIGGISFSGNSNLDSNTILSLIDSNVGDNIFVPGEEIPTAIKNLWKQNMFSDIQIFQTKTEGNIIFLEIYLDQLPKLEKFQFKGLKKSEIDKLREELNLSRGIYVSNQIKNKTENYIIKYFKEKGFLNVTCSVNEETSQDLNSSTLIIDVNKNERVKIKEITISSDENTFECRINTWRL